MGGLEGAGFVVLNSHVTCEECQSQEKDPPVQGGKVHKQCRELGSVVRNMGQKVILYSL